LSREKKTNKTRLNQMTGFIDANYERKPKSFYFHFVSI